MLGKVDMEVQQLVDMLHLDVEEILRQFHFTFEGKRLTEAESIRFIMYLREELEKKNDPQR
ncbi:MULTISPECIES: hypothetical protein [unclassified Paenibacillus]|nr:hypothetical protein [Paenibacillus sp. tmac-D7]